MKVFTPYVAGMLFPLTKAICSASDWQAVEMLTDTDYPDFLAARWREREPFVLCEQDVVPWPGSIEELVACPEPWCGFTYQPWMITGTPAASPMLGLVRFRPEFMEALPDVFEPPWPTWGLRTWLQCDARLVVFAEAHDPPLKFHQHLPSVVHAHGWRQMFGL